MDKQKQIEEMAEIIYKRGVALESIDFIHKSDHFDRIATTLYNAGYRKIPENAVVLTSDEHRELIKGIKTYNYTAMLNARDEDRWEQGYFQGSTTTAKEIILWLDDMYKRGMIVPFNMVLRQLKERYGALGGINER